MSGAGAGFEIGALSPVDAGEREAVLALLAHHHLPVEGLADRWPHVLVARADGVVIGCAALEVYADGVLLRSVAVADAHRGSGLGRALTQAALDAAARLGAPAAYLLTTTAEGFFPKFGFARIARTDVPASVQGSIEFTAACPASAIVMRRRL